jgi:uncharacterized repeat protein (TIGR03803 family)
MFRFHGGGWSFLRKTIAKTSVSKTRMVVLVLLICGSVAAFSQTFTIVNNLSNSEGAYSYFDNLTQGFDGSLWSTTFAQGMYDDGTAYRITPHGSLTVLNNFNSQYAQPTGALVLAPSGIYYGITPAGGASNYGTVFSLDTEGTITVLYSFSGSDGNFPFGPLTLGSDGNLYGTTEFGGSSIYGTVFKITPSGILTTLHSFGLLRDDGYTPEGSALVEAPDGAFYGVSDNGGLSGQGIIYRITSSGNFAVVHNFDYTHGSTPMGTPVLANDGNLYGTTLRGGSNGNGIIFRLELPGKFSVLRNFTFATDGGGPFAGLLQASDSKLYGTTSAGGPDGNGTIFSVTTKGKFSVVNSFDFQAVDTNGIMQHTDGALYGVTQYGGTYDNGVVYRLDVGAPPFAGMVPLFGAVGSRVRILGEGLTGSLAVKFNGVAAAFTVNSDTLISAAVPAGATSGMIEITTPRGPLSSMASFTILK